VHGKARPTGAATAVGARGDFLLPPPSASAGQEAGVVLIPGLNIDSRAYRPLLVALQRAAEARGVSLYAGCVHYDWQVRERMAEGAPWTPQGLGPRIDALTAALQKQGMRSGGPLFHAAHCMSTAFLQDYLAGGRPTSGQILMGGCLLRKHCYPVFSYKVPTLTLAAELDCEEPLMRQAEQYRIHRNLDKAKFPLVVLEGQTHMQFASGSRPGHMKPELPPAVSDEAAHNAIGEMAADFMGLQLRAPGAGDTLERGVRSTGAHLLPALLAQEHAEPFWFNDPGPLAFQMHGGRQQGNARAESASSDPWGDSC